MSDKIHHLCPVHKAGNLDNRMRRWLQNPRKILGAYVKEGMTVLDLGCGPGFFSLPLAEMVGKSGRVIAADLQHGMLAKLAEKIRGTAIAARVQLHQCAEGRIGIEEKVDFVLAFYMVHEVPRQEEFFREVYSLLKPGGQFLVVEPKWFHVSANAFAATIRKAEAAGFRQSSRPRVRFSRTVRLEPSAPA